VALRVLAPHLVEVKHLYVAPDARRRGVAGALMDTLEAEAARRRAAIILETGIRQPEAIALYRARGYGDRARYPQADADAHHSVYLGRDAAP
jgi:ribosomal protein S18 acetylase RimI-like enzyme